MIKLLLVEDDEGVLETLKLTLADEGYDIDATTSGADALQYITKKTYDVVISDMNLGDTSGINILKAARGLHAETKFIMITAYSSIETAVEAIRCGITDYIIKPFDISELKFRVRQAIDKLETDKQRRCIEERYNIIMDNIPFGIAIISPEMEVIEVNKHVHTWLPQIPVSETPSCFTVLCNPPKTEICKGCAVEKTLKDGKTHSQTRNITYNGKPIKLRCTTNPIFDKSNQISGVLKVMEEIKD